VVELAHDTNGSEADGEPRFLSLLLDESQVGRCDRRHRETWRKGYRPYFFFLEAFFFFEVTVVLLWLSAYFLVTNLPVFADREVVPLVGFFLPDDFFFLAIYAFPATWSGLIED
jgi:hypothetical protein